MASSSDNTFTSRSDVGTQGRLGLSYRSSYRSTIDEGTGDETSSRSSLMSRRNRSTEDASSIVTVTPESRQRLSLTSREERVARETIPDRTRCFSDTTSGSRQHTSLAGLTSTDITSATESTRPTSSNYTKDADTRTAVPSWRTSTSERNRNYSDSQTASADSVKETDLKPYSYARSTYVSGGDSSTRGTTGRLWETAPTAPPSEANTRQNRSNRFDSDLGSSSSQKHADTIHRVSRALDVVSSEPPSQTYSRSCEKSSAVKTSGSPNESPSESEKSSSDQSNHRQRRRPLRERRKATGIVQWNEKDEEDRSYNHRSANHRQEPMAESQMFKSSVSSSPFNLSISNVEELCRGLVTIDLSSTSIKDEDQRIILLNQVLHAVKLCKAQLETVLEENELYRSRLVKHEIISKETHELDMENRRLKGDNQGLVRTVRTLSTA